MQLILKQNKVSFSSKSTAKHSISYKKHEVLTFCLKTSGERYDGFANLLSGADMCLESRRDMNFWGNFVVTKTYTSGMRTVRACAN